MQQPAAAGRQADPADRAAVHTAVGAAALAAQTKPPQQHTATTPARVPASRSLLLTADALGPDWDHLNGRDGSATTPHQYCAQAFASDSAIEDRAYGELVRHTDGLRVQQEVIAYDGDGAARALAEFDAALHCGRYSTGEGADRLDVDAEPTRWMQGGADARISGAVAFSKGTVVLHSRLVAFRHGSVLNVLSVALQDQAVLDKEAPTLAAAALRKTGWRHP